MRMQGQDDQFPALPEVRAPGDEMRDRYKAGIALAIFILGEMVVWLPK